MGAEDVNGGVELQKPQFLEQFRINQGVDRQGGRLIPDVRLDERLARDGAGTEFFLPAPEFLLVLNAKDDQRPAIGGPFAYLRLMPVLAHELYGGVSRLDGLLRLA
jgi:hypothetical protein